jgi:hypothetical protein
MISNTPTALLVNVFIFKTSFAVLDFASNSLCHLSFSPRSHLLTSKATFCRGTAAEMAENPGSVGSQLPPQVIEGKPVLEA